MVFVPIFILAITRIPSMECFVWNNLREVRMTSHSYTCPLYMFEMVFYDFNFQCITSMRNLLRTNMTYHPQRYVLDLESMNHAYFKSTKGKNHVNTMTETWFQMPYVGQTLYTTMTSSFWYWRTPYTPIKWGRHLFETTRQGSPDDAPNSLSCICVVWFLATSAHSFAIIHVR